MIEEGVIKYRCEWTKQALPETINLTELISYRTQLWDKGLIGVDSHGIGFGNISLRANKNQFVISGTQTGHIRELTADHFALVEEAQILNNLIIASGLEQPSSESMTHAACYQGNLKCNAVVHIHSEKLWRQYLNQLPTTDATIPYGTPELAQLVFQIAQQQENAVIVLGGHFEGLISFGNTMSRSVSNLIELLSE
jgi:L-ribulose-5-phosphate 4-epimerase